MHAVQRYPWRIIITTTLVAVVFGGALAAPPMGPGVSLHMASAARSGSAPLSASADMTATVTPTATSTIVTVTKTNTPTAPATSTPTVAAHTSTPTTTMTSAPTPTSTGIRSGPALPAGVYHFVGSLVASAGAQVSHVEGILTLQVGANGALTASTLRLTSGVVVPVSGEASQGRLAFDVNGTRLDGESAAVSLNRLSGLFSGPTGGAVGFWVATTIAAGQNGTHYAFAGCLGSGPDQGMAYSGTLELWGDTYGALLGWLRLTNGTVLGVSGQSVNGNVNMLVVVRTGTPMFASGTTLLGGNRRGTIAGPLAGDQGTWTATK